MSLNLRKTAGLDKGLFGMTIWLSLLAACLLSLELPLQAQKSAPNAVSTQAPTSQPPQNHGNQPPTATGQVAPLIPLSERGIRPIAKPFVVVGEVVDAWCYASQSMGSGRGDAHKPCALACIHGGVTVGIVDDSGTLYIAAKHKAYTGCKELLLPYVAQRVKVTGWLTTKGGCNILKIMEVTPVKKPDRLLNGHPTG